MPSLLTGHGKLGTGNLDLLVRAGWDKGASRITLPDPANLFLVHKKTSILGRLNHCVQFHDHPNSWKGSPEWPLALLQSFPHHLAVRLHDPHEARQRSANFTTRWETCRTRQEKAQCLQARKEGLNKRQLHPNLSLTRFTWPRIIRSVKTNVRRFRCINLRLPVFTYTKDLIDIDLPR